MRTRTTSRPCALIDACVIISAHELGLWEPLVQRAELAVPSVVVDEAEHFFGPDGWPSEIDGKAYVKAGKIRKVTADQGELEDLFSLFDEVFQRTLDPGEAEALALLLAAKAPWPFCTSDGHAIQALAMIGCADKGISFEKLLARLGFTLPGSAKHHLKEAFFGRHLREGEQNRITGRGLRRNG